MKTLSVLTLLAVVWSGLVGCRSAQHVPTATSLPSATPLPTSSPSPTVKPTRTPRPTPTPIQYGRPWAVLDQVHYRHAASLAGFLTASYGITVGRGGEVHYTTDGGQTWPRAQNQSLCRFGLDIVDERIAWHCGNGGHVRVTADGGQTWTVVAGFGDNEPDHCRFLRFLDATTGWAATPTRLGATNDGGQTWTEVPTPQGVGEISAIDLRTPLDGYLLDSAGVLAITADGGKTWVTYPLGLSDADKFKASSFTPVAAMRFVDADQGMIALALQSKTLLILRTSDGGQTWQQEAFPLQNDSFLYLAHDGATLTITDPFDQQVIVLYYQG